MKRRYRAYTVWEYVRGIRGAVFAGAYRSHEMAMQRIDQIVSNGGSAYLRRAV